MSNYICNIRCSYRQPSGYCGRTGGYETCQYRQLHVDAKPKTNADRVRSMTDEELAELLEGCVCPKSPCPDIDRDTPTDKARCTRCWLDWLKEEASDDNDDH